MSVCGHLVTTRKTTEKDDKTVTDQRNSKHPTVMAGSEVIYFKYCQFKMQIDCRLVQIGKQTNQDKIDIRIVV